MPTLIDPSVAEGDSGEFRLDLLRRTIATLFAIANTAALMSGCGERQQIAPRVDAAVARESLKSALESWKKGEKPEAAKDRSPSIVIQDLDWSGGMVLTDYSIEGEGKFDDANLRVPVTLTLKQPNGKPITRKASYVVGTSPTITVFREMP